jgi:hypothetical protein
VALRTGTDKIFASRLVSIALFCGDTIK